MAMRIVCAGDSQTRGQYGVGYIPILAERLRGQGVTFTNAGVNGDTSANLLARLDDVIAAQPDVVSVLIGTNDAWATLSAANAEKVMQKKGLAVAPTLERYRENLAAIIGRLDAETDAHLAVLSPPALGQDLASPAVRIGAQFAEAAWAVAADHHVEYLPLFERQRDYLEGCGAIALPYPEGLVQRYTSVLGHKLLRRSYDAIAEGRQLALTSDFVHQNSRGATMIADLLEGFLRETALPRSARLP
ncbi:SGNH/GDSL hydrolase family protein [Nocardia crassostreae]|uniref:SGNH/GDSL hydrolase family protein n=1 Tax=Nocardia crassostreae TaxID=53428 RepID=UPI00082B3F69|nr:GDSL-type esterase/lipase family protein [Nocardia crassostreae]